MKTKEAIELVEQRKRLICHDCIHPAMVGWCENHCGLPEAFDMAIEALKAQEKAEEVSNDSPELDKENGGLIRRKSAIDALKEAFNPSITNFVKAKIAIDKLSSAQPEIIHCRECINHTYIRQIEGGTIGVCESLGLDTYGSWYCGNAERRADERQT